MPTWRRRASPRARLLGSVGALTLTLVASFAGPLSTRGEVLPDASLPIPSLPIPSLLPLLPIPSLLPSLPIPSLLPSLPLPSFSIPPLELPSVSDQPSSSILPSPTAATAESTPAPTPVASGEDDASGAANVLLTAASPSGAGQPPSRGADGGPFGSIGLPQLVGAGSAAFLVGLVALYLAAGAGWLAVVRRKLGGIGLRVTAWREERLGGRHPGL